MLLHERLKLFRKEKKLTQDEFGKKLNLTKFAISNYENGRNNIPDRVISDICREWNINKNWLLYGEGDMSNNSPSLDIEMLTSGINANSNIYKLIKSIVQSYQKLTPENQIIVNNFIDSILNSSEE